MLIVEDEVQTSAFLKHVLERERFDVLVAEDGETALEVCATNDPDIVLLDYELPGISGQETCRVMRSMTDAYIVMLTGRDDEVDKVISLSLGADDYVIKPFSHRELVARMYSLLRRPRTKQPGASSGSARSFGEVVIDIASRVVLIDGEDLQLTRTEFDLLDVLTVDAGKVVSRSDLLKRVWRTDWDGGDHLIDAHVHNLRKKLASRGAGRYLRTVRGVGYKFVPGG